MNIIHKLSINVLAFAGFAAIGLLMPSAVLADTCTWTGADSGNNINFSNSGNWSGCNGNVPEAGDDLVFPDIANNDAFNNQAVLLYNSITFSSNTEGYTISGNAISTEAITNGGFENVIEPVVTLTTSGGVASITNQGLSLLGFEGGLTLSGAGIITINVASNSSVILGDTAIFTGSTTNLTFTGGGEFVVRSEVTPTFTANVLLEDYAIYVCGTPVNCLSTNDVSILDNAKLLFDRDQSISLANDITMAGSVTERVEILAEEGVTVTFNGVITIDNVGIGMENNSGTPATIVFANSLVLSGNDALLRINNGEDLLVIFEGVVSGEGSVLFSSNNHLRTMNDHTYSGNTNINSSTLSGTGSFAGQILTQFGGSINPGMSAGCITGEEVVINVDSFYEVELGGTTACSGYDQIIGETSAELDEASFTLSLINGFLPSLNDVFTIVRSPEIEIASHGVNLTSGYVELADNATFTQDGYTYRINYNIDADGEDTITLTVVAVPVIPQLPETGFNLILPALLAAVSITGVALKSRKRD